MSWAAPLVEEAGLLAILEKGVATWMIERQAQRESLAMGDLPDGPKATLGG
jgi:hypothetical protein